MTEQLSVTLAKRLPEIARLAGLVEAFREAHGLSSDMVFSITVSLDEVLSNVFSYAYDDTGEHEVDVRVTLDGNQVSVEVEDDGLVVLSDHRSSTCLMASSRDEWMLR